jgi:protein-S-isoprenylcysteine O-methyltransferase Ste14
MKLIGKPTVNPMLFYSGKILGYITWILFILCMLNITKIGKREFNYINIVSCMVGLIGLLLIIISLFNLGNSTRLGLPLENTTFKKSGLYKLSRNPMYLGFNFLTISSMIFTGNFVIIVMGIYSILVYHIIIIKEENFLEQRFGKEYIEYKKKVRRYL